jgi:hypothetical protein
MLDVAQSMMVLVLGILAIIVLLGVLVIVHRQTNRVKELEMRMKAMDKLEANQTTEGEVK